MRRVSLYANRNTKFERERGERENAEERTVIEGVKCHSSKNRHDPSARGLVALERLRRSI